LDQVDLIKGVRIKGEVDKDRRMNKGRAQIMRDEGPVGMVSIPII
jgi:hypothetical protein